MAADWAKLGGVFVVVLGLVIGIQAVLPAVIGTGAPSGVQPQNASTFNPDRILANETRDSGTVTVENETSGKVVLIDAAHKNTFSRSDLQPLVRSLTEQGHTVRYYGQQSGGSGFGPSSGLNASLRKADAFVVISPGVRYTQSEVRGVTNFTERGGRLLMLGEPETVKLSRGGTGGLFGLSVQELQSQLTPLSSEYGTSVGTGYLFNMHENANNFQNVYATPSAQGPLTDGVDRIVLAEGTPVSTNQQVATSSMTTIEQTKLSTTRNGGPYTVVARTGNATTIGDTSFFTPDFYQSADNEVLLGNVIEFLVTGDKAPKPEPATQQPGPGRENPFGPGSGSGPGPGPGPSPGPGPNPNPEPDPGPGPGPEPEPTPTPQNKTGS